MTHDKVISTIAAFVVENINNIQFYIVFEDGEYTGSLKDFESAVELAGPDILEALIKKGFYNYYIPYDSDGYIAIQKKEGEEE